MWSNRNKAPKERVKDKAPQGEAPKRREARKPSCRCGGSGWIRETIPASARGPATYVKKRCACKN